jgi:hypothetical protein
MLPTSWLNLLQPLFFFCLCCEITYSRTFSTCIGFQLNDHCQPDETGSNSPSLFCQHRQAVKRKQPVDSPLDFLLTRGPMPELLLGKWFAFFFVLRGVVIPPESEQKERGFWTRGAHRWRHTNYGSHFRVGTRASILVVVCGFVSLSLSLFFFIIPREVAIDDYSSRSS